MFASGKDQTNQVKILIFFMPWGLLVDLHTDQIRASRLRQPLIDAYRRSYSRIKHSDPILQSIVNCMLFSGLTDRLGAGNPTTSDLFRSEHAQEPSVMRRSIHNKYIKLRRA